MPPTPPTPIYSTSTVASELGITRKAATMLVKSGVAGEVYADGHALACTADAVAALNARLLADTTIPAIQVKMTTPDFSTYDRRWIGWHDGYTEAEKEAATSGWWQVANPDHLVATRAALVATVSGFVVRVRIITGYERTNHYGRRVRFDTADPTPAQHAAYSDRRLSAEAGPVTKLWSVV